MTSNTTKVNRMIVAALKTLEQVSAQQGPQASVRPKSRVGKKTIAGHFEPEVAWRLRKLALDQNTTVQKLLEEALDDLFAKHHLTA